MSSGYATSIREWREEDIALAPLKHGDEFEINSEGDGEFGVYNQDGNLVDVFDESDVIGLIDGQMTDRLSKIKNPKKVIA